MQLGLVVDIYIGITWTRCQFYALSSIAYSSMTSFIHSLCWLILMLDIYRGLSSGYWYSGHNAWLCLWVIQFSPAFSRIRSPSAYPPKQAGCVLKTFSLYRVFCNISNNMWVMRYLLWSITGSLLWRCAEFFLSRVSGYLRLLSLCARGAIWMVDFLVVRVCYMWALYLGVDSIVWSWCSHSTLL